MSDVRVYIRPVFEGPDKGEGGIRRWVESQHRYLSDYGVVPVKSEPEADVVVCHAGDIVDTAKPLVVHNHGLYATRDQQWDKWAHMLNSNVIELLRRADIATVPSRWCAEQVARGMSISARVLYAGIDPDLWGPGSNGHYVLWNKTRVDPVCDPTALNKLAVRNPKMRFLTTYGENLPNLQRTGKLGFSDAQGIIRNAEIYLSTTRETFGIGTVEAMAAGVPVLGWAFGGNLDIVKHKKTGYLAIPGNYDDLQAGLEWLLARRDEIGQAARFDVLHRYTWRRAVEECAGIYREAAGLARPRPRVSVIVTCYKLEEYLPDCLNSLIAQTSPDWECIIVDDCSPGNCADVAATFAQQDPRFVYLRTPHNLYLAGARNFGIGESNGRYIIPLDADDMLNPRALEVMGDFLDKQPGYAIAYGAFELIEPDGRRWISGWPQQFKWEHQMAHRNQLMYASMYRRWVWERSGGYRERCKTAEDADFWCRVTSYGARAYKCTDYPTLLYRNRPESMSHVEAEPDWTQWYPGARDKSVTPFGAVGDAPNKMSWPVSTYAEPLVSVVIPVGPGHENIVRDALDSVAAQTMPRWECIVVNDTGHSLPLAGFPWVRVLSSPAPGSGPAIARNLGIAAARAPLFALLDADDYLMPTFISRCMAIQKDNGGYAYTDWFQISQDGASETKETQEYSVEDLAYKGFFHAITGVYPKQGWVDVGGFDPASGGWEDWDFVFALATKGYCGNRVPEPLFCYRYWAGKRREGGYQQSADNAALLRSKWSKFLTKEGLMGCGSCGKGGGRPSTRGAATVVADASLAAVSAAAASGMTLIEYIGASAGTRTYRGVASGTLYRFSSSATNKRKYVYSADAVKFLSMADFVQVTAVPDVPAAPTEPIAVRQAENRIVMEPEPVAVVAEKAPEPVATKPRRKRRAAS
jgi:glycosyltransferase involved in cell wall biosynthesis